MEVMDYINLNQKPLIDPSQPVPCRDKGLIVLPKISKNRVWMNLPLGLFACGRYALQNPMKLFL